MGLNIGNTTIGGIYLGNTKISEAYLGSTKIYSAAAPQPTDEVQIGNQIWKTKNLAIDDGQGGIYTQTVNYGQGDVVEYYYNWDAAVRIVASIPGWHLPTYDEINTLATTVGGTATGGTKLKSTYGWTSGNGTDNYGFAAFPAGKRQSGTFYNFGSYAYFWMATKSSNQQYPYEFNLPTNGKINIVLNFNSININYTVRLVKD